MNILALDLSLTSTGVAYPDGATDTWGPKLTGPARLSWFRTGLIDLLSGVDVDLVVIEEYAFHGKFAHSHEIGELGGVIRLALHDRGQRWVPVIPSSLKLYATGRGNAGKEEVLVAAVRLLGYDGHSNDEADAAWLRAMALDFYGHPLVKFPATHRKALGKVPWPVLEDAA
jgi:Holliday junction resolvasome RuvABC endonuclease subunit